MSSGTVDAAPFAVASLRASVIQLLIELNDLGETVATADVIKRLHEIIDESILLYGAARV